MNDPAAKPAWLSIIGIGEDGWDGLNAEAKRLIASAEMLYGGARHLDHVPEDVSAARRVAWPSPMAPAIEDLLTRHRGRRVTVLASGDPMLYGIGVTLTRALQPDEFHVLPQPSACALACARLGWPIAEITLISLVSRPVQQVVRYLAPGQRLILYSEDGSTPGKVAHLLAASGFGDSTLHVLEHLGGRLENRQSSTAAIWSAERATERSRDLNVIAVECLADAGARPLTLVPGLTESAYENDGQLTKREVRAVTLALLAPLPGQMLWDVGAGAGSVGIEWMRAHPSCKSIAFEAREDRASRIEHNARQLGVPGLQVVRGTAPASFGQVPAPDAIFIGGGIGVDGLFEECWRRLPSGGRLVANAVTVANEAVLAGWHTLHGGELVRTQIARADRVGSTFAWRPLMPITQWAVSKG